MHLLTLILGKIRLVLSYLRAHLKASIALGVSLLLAGSVYAVTRPKQLVYVTAIAERGDLRQVVEAVGTVISETDVQLQFPTVDIVSHVYVKEGDHVKAGTRLAALRSGSLAAGIAGASAGVQSAQAQLEQLVQGSRPEDIQIAEAQVRNKQASLDAATQSLKNAEDSVKTALSQLAILKNEAAVSLSGQVATMGSTIAEQLATAKTALLATRGVFDANDVQDGIVKALPSGYDSFQLNTASALTIINALALAPSPTDYQTTLKNGDSARVALVTTADIVNRAYDIVSLLPISSYFTSTSRETNKATIATQKSYVQMALSTLDSGSKSLRDASATYDTKIGVQQTAIITAQGNRESAKAEINTYQTALVINQAQLALTRAPARQTDIDAAKARVRQAQADLARAVAQYNDTILIAPFEGTITKVHVKIGEMRPASEPAITMLGQAPYRIEMFLSEVDIPKVQSSQTGSITLDAFQGMHVPLRVSEIDAAATDKDGVSKYRVRLDFISPQAGLKIGMTGDAEIVTGFTPSVMSVPIRSVLDKADGSKYVRILDANGTSFTERTVTPSMEGEGGNVEVSGVEQGEVVVVLIKQ